MNLIPTILVCAIICACGTAASFDISSVSTCTNQTSQGFCLRWEQNGTVYENVASCFPAETSLLLLENGEPKTAKIESLKVGDLVLGVSNGQETYSKIIGWLHRQPDQIAEYLEVVTEEGRFLVSAFHNIALANKTYSFAKDLNGEHLYNGKKVLAINKVQSKGVYAPLTTSNNFYVSVGEGQTLAHCFANLRNPEFYESIFSVILNIWGLIDSRQTNEEGILPAAAWMKKTFSFLIEE